ncbi:MAG: ABC transporter ATP-binding protein [Acidobacteriota bacterium]|nr:ABC transporter ATP-binding protein [Acidobacteriota bacterium]
MSESNGTIVSMRDVKKVYEQGSIEVHALRGIDLTIQKGEFTAICGPSGSGKTTTLNLIGALDAPTSGDITIEGESLLGKSRKQLSQLRRDRIGFVFQAYNLMPVLTAYENAEIVLAVQGVPYEERHGKVMKLLADVGLEGMEDRKPMELSGGQQQRVAVARAIASNPAIVLADEPTANVDSETADRLLDMMETLNREAGITFLFSTHDSRVMDRARRVVRIVDGAVESDETKA